MKNLGIFILACLLFVLLVIPGVVYTAFYYLRKERNKTYKYTYRCAFAIDVLANVLFGEFFEYFICKSRGCTNFGELTSISAATGELIETNNITRFGNWFSERLDIVFRERDHCLNAYRKEIKCNEAAYK